MTLTETAKFTKRGLLTVIILLILSLSGWIGYKYYYHNYVYLPSIQPKPILPDIKFGILPYPSLVRNDISPSNYSYSIDTPTGSLPNDFPTVMDVYFIPKTSITLLAPDRTKELAQSFGFKNGPEIKSPVLYEFTDESGGKFIIDLETLNFKFRKNIATDSAKPKDDFDTTIDKILPDPASLIGELKFALENRNLLNKDLQDGKSEVTYEKDTQSESNTALVSLWQKDINSYPIVTPEFTQGRVKAVATKFKGENRFASLDYIYWPVNTEEKAIYYIKSVDEALTDLKNGLGVVVKEPKSTTVSITDAYLAYLLPENYTPFLQPVFVFEGPDFASIVPAIKAEFLKPPN